MKYLKRISSIISVAVVLFILGVVINGLSISASAVTCTAGNHNFSKYCDATHPHRNYQVCNWCGMKQYLSTYTTKKHGNGEWGSGTCPSCGTHTYVGRTCTSRGTCACGATIAPYAHSYTQYCDASHPHRDYKVCTGCGYKYYLNTYSTKNHGNGAYGSGTCPSCGTHTFVGQTCVSQGTCSCGATISPSGHSYTQYCEAAHPHQDFKKCAICGYKYYLNTYSTKNHGDGSWGSGTCPQCGEHTWIPDISFPSLTPPPHPHLNNATCSCGETTTLYALYSNCSECTAGSKSVSSTSEFDLVLLASESDLGTGTFISVPCKFYITHSQESKIENGKMHIFKNSVSSYAEATAATSYKFCTVVNRDVVYYDATGGTQTHTLDICGNQNIDAVSLPPYVRTLNPAPSHAVSSSCCSLYGGVGLSYVRSTTTYFNN